MSSVAAVNPKQQFKDALGVPLVNGTLDVYLAGTTTRTNTWQDKALTTLNSNPITLDSRGECLLWLDGDLTYKFVLKNSAGVTQWTVDNISGAASGSLGNLNFIQAGTGARTRTAQDKAREHIGPEDFEAATAAGTALIEIEAAWTSGVGVQVPTGTYTLDQAVLLNENRMNLQGAGRHATTLAYNIADAGPAITVNNPDSGGYNQGRVVDVAFRSSNSTAKTFLDLVNVANFEVSRIATNSSLWPGDSIGVRTRGRQLVVVRDSEIGCARPIVISPNATWPTLATDHFEFARLELIGSSATRDVIEIESGACFSSMTLRHVSVVKGRHGIYWNDTSSTAASFGLLIDELRTEQGLDATAYSIRLESTAQNLQNVAITNSYLDSGRNGIYLRNAQRVTIDNVTYAGGAGKAALDITMVAGGRLSLRNFLHQSGATVTITNGRCISREVRANGVTALVRNEEWVYDAGTAEGSIQSDVYHSGVPFTLAADGIQTLADGNYVGLVFISTSENVTGIYNCLGTSNTTQEVSDPSAFFTPTVGTAASYNVYHNGTNYVIQNKRGLSVTFNVFRVGYGK